MARKQPLSRMRSNTAGYQPAIRGRALLTRALWLFSCRPAEVLRLGGPAESPLSLPVYRSALGGLLGEFLAFILILFTLGWGSAFLLPYVRRHWGKLDRTVDHETLARLLEDTDQLAARLTQVEDELHFFKELNAPDDQERLSSPDMGGEGA
jgi:hypothetical protein